MDPNQPKPAVSKWLWITLILVVLIAGGFFAWYYLMGPGKTVATTPITTPVAITTDKLLAGYSKYTNDTYGVSFQYPKVWASSKKEETTETSSGVLGKDLVYKVTFNDPDMKAKIDCLNNEALNWKDATPTKATCDPILTKMTAAEKEKLTGPRRSDDIYLRVYKKPADFTDLSIWLTSTFKQPNSELENYAVGKAITLGGQKGFFSSIGCCAGVDRNYVVEKGDYVYSLGSSYFDTDIKDAEMPATFLKIAPTLKFTTATSATADWKNFTNTKYGFTLTLNNTWQGYKYQEVPSTSFQTAFIRFDMPTTDMTVKENAALNGRYSDIFSIVIYTPAQWDIVQKAADADTKDLKANNTYINKNSNYVFAYAKATNLPTDLASTDFKVADIIATFTFTK